MLGGEALVTSTNATSSPRSTASTRAASSLKPPNRSFSSPMNSAIASRKGPPVIRPIARRIVAALFAMRFSENFPPDRNACTNHFMVAESSASMRRCGASRKSSAFAVGGARTMIS